MFLILLTVLIALLFYLVPYNEKNSGITYKAKWLFAFVYIWILKRKKAPTFYFKRNTKDFVESGLRASQEIWFKESPAPLTNDLHAADTIGFWGVDNHGNAIITKLSRRHDRRVDTVIYVKLASGEEYQLPIHPHVQVFNTDGKSFSAGGLAYEIIEPLRRWRVSFNGVLRKGVRKVWSQSDDDTLAVQFSFIWRPMYSYMAMPDDVSIVNLATTVANMKWTSHFFQTCNILPDEWYEQFGEFNGTLQIEDKEEIVLLLRGQKHRHTGVEDWRTAKHGISIKGVLKTGKALHIQKDEDAYGLENFFHGHIIPPSNMWTYTMEKCSLNVLDTINDTSQDVYFHCQSENRDFPILVKKSNFGFTTYMGDNWECEVTTTLVSLQLNGKEGFGVIEFRKPHTATCPVPKQVSLPHLVEPDIAESEKFIVSFTDYECRSSKLVGGKGASLALLTFMKDDNPCNFEVPVGFCITNTAFNYHLDKNQTVIKSIKRLENVAWKRKDGVLKDECNKVIDAMLATKLPVKLQETLKQYLTSFGGKDMLFAVRSSAIGEDSEELSAAGQNETYLGVKGINEIENAILKCWASQFSFRSTEYKRQYGQLLNRGMGVVIQQMVPSEVAGVIFTRDPQTSSPAYLTITSNFGLGESVVSATVDPDSIILKRTQNDSLTVHNKVVGKKNTIIVMEENGGTKESVLDSNKSSVCSVTDDIVIQLGKISIYLEKRFGNARDNEWAIFNNKIYILQSRPITSNQVLTDYEVLHEFNGNSLTDDESYTTANIQEVMPGASTPITFTSNLRVMALGFMKIARLHKNVFLKFETTVFDGLASFYSHCIFNRIQLKSWNLGEKTKSSLTKAFELGFFGRVVEDEEAVKMANERFEDATWLSGLATRTFVIPGLLFGPFIMAYAEKKFRNYEIAIHDKMTPMEVYKKVEDHLLDSEKAVTSHMQVTMASSVWNLIILKKLSKTGEFNIDHYADFAALIGSQNGTESGGVPTGLQVLAQTITEEIEPENFSTMTPENALHWINNTSIKGKQKFHKFLKDHGHRGYKEFEMKTVTWGMDHLKLVTVIQNMLKTKVPLSITKTDNSIDAAINKMKVPIHGFERRIFSVFLRICRKYVCYREQAKSLMINFEHSLRKGYHHLAKVMVEYGYIPDSELMFFFTQEELKWLLETRSPRLIMRAKRRQRHYAYMDSIQFPEMFDRYPPTPIAETVKNEPVEGVLQVKGYPACSGVIEGTARVLKSFSEVDQIEFGDILITYATDIGWSPYFPMLSGVVTEIGGLISHGAVVAREYGLPCLIAAENVTSLFKSGETVRLDAINGILYKSG